MPGLQKKIKRNWVTYSHEHNSLYCSVCLVYSSECNKSVFTRPEGFNQWLHVYERIKEHE